MIPKKIHWCWFSADPLPAVIQRCLRTWEKVFPDFEIVRWDARSFDVDINPYVAAAYRARKWAFVTDYARMHILHECGGVYLDSDVEVIRRFDQFLDRGVLTAVEYHPRIVKNEGTLELLYPDGSSLKPGTRKPGIGIQAAILAGRVGHPFFGECMEYYKDKPFELVDGRYVDPMIAPDIFAVVAERYGFRYRDELQELREDMLILPSRLVAGNRRQTTRETYAVHLCAGSWRPWRHARGAVRRVLDLLR